MRRAVPQDREEVEPMIRPPESQAGPVSMDPVDALETGLLRRGYRLTHARHTILGVMAEFARPFTATELQEAVAARNPQVGRASVYRTLLLLEELGYVEKLHQSGSEHYTLCLVSHHHHHLTCTQCGRTVELVLEDDVDVLSALDRAARALGYLPRTHVLAVYGICPACQTEGRAPVAAAPAAADLARHPNDSRHPIGRRRPAARPAPLTAPHAPPSIPSSPRRHPA